MVDITDLTHVLATLNATTTTLLCAGFWCIRQGRRSAHKAFMLSAVSVAVMFFAVYVVYHLEVGMARFGGEGTVRTVYFSILAAHVAVAMAIPVLVPVTAFRALRGRFEGHRRLARWLLPLWFYVSLSGIVVYVMAVHLYPYG